TSTHLTHGRTKAKLPGPPARTLKHEKPGRRPRSASAAGSARSRFRSLPAPHLTILRVNDLTDALETALRAGPFRRDLPRPGVGAEDANEPAAEREGDPGLGRLRGVPTLLVRRIDPVGDLDDPFRVRRALEPAASNDGAGVPIRGGKSEQPGFYHARRPST